MKFLFLGLVWCCWSRWHCSNCLDCQKSP